MPDVSRSPQWHAIRPWSPRFLLTVREITSVSATFVLSSTCARDGVDARFASLGTSSSLSSDDEEAVEDEGETARIQMSKLSMVSDAVGRGLSVNVNGAPWKRVLMRMDEKSDDDGDEESTIVIYGLMPGRQYDIEIGISFADGEDVLHSRMVTHSHSGQSNNEGDTTIESASSTVSVIPSSSSTVTPLNAQRPAITLEEYATQLRSQLAYLNQQRDQLTAQLKAARKEAHKADAMKRNEIDTLKRTAEKHAAMEARGRQKARALQEAAKQAAAAARGAEESTRELEAMLPALRMRENDLTAEHASIYSDATQAQAKADEILAADRTRADALRNELNGLKTRLDKLQAKKSRLSGEALPKSEQQLEGLVREVELVVRDAGAFEVIDNGPVGLDRGVRPVTDIQQGPSIGQTSGGSSSSSASLAAQTNQHLSQFGLKPIQGNAAPSTGSMSILSSRAPRLGPAFQFQSNSATSIPRRANSLIQAQRPLNYTQSQSVDISSSSSASTASAISLEDGSNYGPMRQSSLPLRVPSRQ